MTIIQMRVDHFISVLILFGILVFIGGRLGLGMLIVSDVYCIFRPYTLDLDSGSSSCFAQEDCTNRVFASLRISRSEAILLLTTDILIAVFLIFDCYLIGYFIL